MVFKITENIIREKLESNLSRQFGISPQVATEKQMYDAVVMTVRNHLLEQRKVFNAKAIEQKAKKVYYLCMEFLLGRSLKTSVHNLKIDNELANILNEYGFSLEKLYENEPDAGLGNGGLGRLAACYMDSLASLDYPAMGFSLRYEYGLFKQKVIDGWQTELPDIWLPGGEVWLTPRPDKNTIVKFGGTIDTIDKGNGRLEFVHKDCKEVEAMAYDMMISGSSEGVSVLRLWRARNIHKFNMGSFSQGDYMRAMKEDNEAELITKVLYPSDDHIEGKALRLSQQYFLVCASVNSIVRDIVRNGKDIRKMPDLAAIHINDTHPALVIPELMRILLDEYKLSWEESWDLINRTVAYTNHTVLSEALECWSTELISTSLPRIWQILCEIDRRYKEGLYSVNVPENIINKTAVIDYGTVRMANLSVIGAHRINGVSALHSDILKKTVFKNFHSMMPHKFINVTNGIAHRRWLVYSNPRLASLLDETIGEAYKNDASRLIDFKKFENNKEILNRLDNIKYENKVDFANFVKETQGIIIDPKSRFDVQVKRLHEYKRQLLNAMKIINLINSIKQNPNLNVVPQTFIFGAKAAPSYYMAKEIIKLICFIQKELDENPKIKEKINVVFLENYCVSMAEKLMPASEISEQISTAGKEASGTGNMKFMINGTVTIGTLDGANVEIAENVGSENIFIFGKSTPEVDALWEKGYNSAEYFNNNQSLRSVVETLNTGIGGMSFGNISSYLLNGHSIADPYMCMADFDSYMGAHYAMDKAYSDKLLWNKMSLNNIATAGVFAADRAIEEYASKIWMLKKVKI